MYAPDCVSRSVHRWSQGEKGVRGDRIHMFRSSELRAVTRSWTVLPDHRSLLLKAELSSAVGSRMLPVHWCHVVVQRSLC